MSLAHPVAATLAEPVLPPLTPARLVGDWTVDWALVAGLAVVAALYLVGVARMRGRGAGWPARRTASFLVGGLGTAAVATMSGLGTYDDTLFSVHMVQHMVLTMVAPVFLALGAPVTLALRALPGGPRRGLVRLLHSRAVRLLTGPVIGPVLFVASPFALYFTALYPATLRNDVLHELVHVHFLLIGCLFFWPLLGLDPLPRRLAHGLRMLLVFVTVPFHAFLGVAVMTQGTVIAGGYYAGLHRMWGASPLADQRTGGAILWSSGDLVGLLFLAVLLVQWMRADERAAARADRAADRAVRATGARSPADDELAAYNARLAALARRAERTR